MKFLNDAGNFKGFIHKEHCTEISKNHVLHIKSRSCIPIFTGILGREIETFQRSLKPFSSKNALQEAPEFQ